MAIAPPTLLSPKPEAEQFYREPCTKGRIVWTTLSSAVGVSAIALKILVFQSDRIGGTICSFAAGFFLQNAIQTALPHKFSIQEMSFGSDYILAIFLITTQAYANTSLSPLAKEVILSSQIGLYGTAMAIMGYILFTRGLVEGKESYPLLGSKSKDDSLHKGIFSSTSRRRFLVASIEAIGGIGVLIAGSKVAKLAIFYDFGSILCGDAIGQLFSEYCHYKINQKVSKVKTKQDPINLASNEAKLAGRYQAVAKVVHTLAHILPGTFIVAAGSVQQKSAFAASVFYGLVGFMGIRRHLEKARFFASSKNKLTELHRKQQPLNLAEKSFRIIKWGVALSTLTYLTLGIIGFDFATNRLDQFSDIAATDLATFGACLFGSYAISEIAKRLFKKDQNSPWKNEFYFNTHYSLGPPIVALYLLEKMKIGDIALSHDKLFADVLSAIAYASLGFAIGQEANVRGEWNHPRIFSTLSAALLGKFFMRMITGEIK